MATPPLTHQEQRAINKDAHLVAAAAATGRVVLSLDDAMRSLLVRLASPFPEKTRDLSWANPAADDQHDRVMVWLGGDGDPHRSWRITP